MPDDDLRLARRRVLMVTLVIAAHLVVAAWHYAAHDGLGVSLPGWETGFVALFGMVAPVLALVLMWGQRWRAGALLLGLSMVAALGLDLARHYAFESAHHLQNAPEGDWSRAYRLTALLLVLTESFALAASSWVLRQTAAPSARATRRTRRK